MTPVPCLSPCLGSDSHVYLSLLGQRGLCTQACSQKAPFKGAGQQCRSRRWMFLKLVFLSSISLSQDHPEHLRTQHAAAKDPSQWHSSRLHRFQSSHFPSAGMTQAHVGSCSFHLLPAAREHVFPASSRAVTFLPAGKITLVTTWEGLQLLSFSRAREEGEEAMRDLHICTTFFGCASLSFGCLFFFTSQTNCFLMCAGFVCLLLFVWLVC